MFAMKPQLQRRLNWYTCPHHFEHHLLFRYIKAHRWVLLNISWIFVNQVTRGFWHNEIIPIILTSLNEFIIVRKWIRPSNCLKTVNQMRFTFAIQQIVFDQKIFIYLTIFLSGCRYHIISYISFLKPLNSAHNAFLDFFNIMSQLVRKLQPPLEKGHRMKLTAFYHVVFQ